MPIFFTQTKEHFHFESRYPTEGTGEMISPSGFQGQSLWPSEQLQSENALKSLVPQSIQLSAAPRHETFSLVELEPINFEKVYPLCKDLLVNPCHEML